MNCKHTDLIHDLANKLQLLILKVHSKMCSQESIELILSDLNDLATLIRKISREEQRPSYYYCTLNELKMHVKNMIEKVKPNLPDVKMEFQYLPLTITTHSHVLFEADLFQQIIDNLAFNSVQASAKTMTLTMKPSSSRLELLFEDDGNGFPVPGSREFSPLGFGTHIIINNTHRLQGSVTFRNSCTSGAQVIFGFPLCHEI